jgi:hypothetical protein
MYRFQCELKWLEANADSVDRVLHSDAFDVFFQGDPFASHISFDSLKLVVEPHCIRSCGWNLAWVKQCYGEQGMHDLEHSFIICGGSIGGSAAQYIKLLRLMQTQKEWRDCWGASLD